MNVPKTEKEIVIAFFLKALLFTTSELVFNIIYLGIILVNVLTLNAYPLKKNYQGSRIAFYEAVKELQVVLTYKPQAQRLAGK